MPDSQSISTIDQAIELLKSLGMSGYEAKAYLALLGSAEPLNGYEVAKVSGVPRSTIYETLAKLTSVGAAIPVRRREGRNGGAATYVAVPADTLIARYRRDVTRRLDGLTSILPQFSTRQEGYVVQNLTGNSDILQSMHDVIGKAEKYLFLSIWPNEAGAILPAVLEAHQRGVEVTSLHFGSPEAFPGRAFAHDFSSPELVIEILGCQIFSVVADHREAVIGASEGDFIWGLWSDNPAVAMLAAEYIRHDIAIQVMAAELAALGRANYLQGDYFDFLRNSSRFCIESMMRTIRSS
jgi:sugar-specific transcriptional regulator TrmB